MPETAIELSPRIGCDVTSGKAQQYCTVMIATIQVTAVLKIPFDYFRMRMPEPAAIPHCKDGMIRIDLPHECL